MRSRLAPSAESRRDERRDKERCDNERRDKKRRDKYEDTTIGPWGRGNTEVEMKGRQDIAASRQRVWDALNDPEALKAAIPGCESFERGGENQYTARITSRIGPVKAGFSFDIELSELDPPNSYVLHGKGRGGAAGFANGSAKVSLDAEGGNTVLNYELDASVGGKLAQLGGRLIDGAAKKLADEFFSRLGEVVAAREEESLSEEDAEPEEVDADDETGAQSRRVGGMLNRLGAILRRLSRGGGGR